MAFRPFVRPKSIPLENDILCSLQEDIINTIYSSPPVISDTGKKRTRTQTQKNSPHKKQKIEDTSSDIILGRKDEELSELKNANNKLKEKIQKLEIQYNILSYELENSNTELNLYKKKKLYVCF